MKHFWTTAAVAALCALTAQAWAAPHRHHPKHAKPAAAHHLRGAKASRAGRAHSHTSRASRSASAIKTEGGASAKVGKGDTLIGLSRRSGVSVEELARLNHLQKPYHLRLGSRVKLPSRRYYTVKSGDTLYSLARRFGVGEGELSDFNNVAHGKHIRAGQKLYLPGQAEDATVPAAPARPLRPRTVPIRPGVAPETEPAPAAEQPAQPSPSYPPPTVTAPAAPSSSAPPSSFPSQPFELTPAPRPPVAVAPPIQTPGRPIIQTAPAPSASDVIAAGRGKFSWPVEGRLISGFGPKSDGQRNDGVNIAGSVGDAVHASADGEVVYAGDQVPSFGNLVLIKHIGGWVTAYAHMSSITVKNRDQVSKGQQIGLIGQTGSVSAPQLHFEIRYAGSPKDKAVPIDPMLLLQAQQ